MLHEDHLKIVIKNTFTAVSATYARKKEGAFTSCGVSRLVFPRKSAQSGGDIRVSEQEVRFIFVEELVKYLATPDGEEWDVHYSVETPTVHNYAFPKNAKPIHYGTDKQGRSANIDLTIHDNTGMRVALIEFKHGHDFQAMNKDFLKLAKEPDAKYRYFIGLLSSSDNTTVTRLQEKIQSKDSYLDENTRLIYYSLEHDLDMPKVVIGEDLLEK